MANDQSHVRLTDQLFKAAAVSRFMLCTKEPNEAVI